MVELGVPFLPFYQAMEFKDEMASRLSELTLDTQVHGMHRCIYASLPWALLHA